MYWKRCLKKRHWEILKGELIDFFRVESRSTEVNIDVLEWPRFVQKEILWDQGLIPALISDYGPLYKICIKKDIIHPLAFDEDYGHLSYLFTGRLYNLNFKNTIERCLIAHVQADPLEKNVYFIKFKRHLEGYISEVNIPCTLTGLLASPAYLKGYHVELMMPTIRCEVVGSSIPPPFQIDVSNLDYIAPYNSIYLNDILDLLPKDESVLFHRSYNLNTQEVVCTYAPGSIPEQPLPANFIDRNFINKKGNKIHLTYKGFWPKQ